MLGRYKNMRSLCDALPADMPVCAVSYERLTSDPEGTLETVSRFLDLHEPLRPEYSVSERTGRWGVGDGSHNIRSGRILPRDPGPEDNSRVPDEVRAGFEGLKAHLAARSAFAAL